jgi:hypothetical protein
MKKNILICGYPNTVLRIFIDVLKDHYTVHFLSYSKKAQYTEIKKILGDTAYLLDTESGSKLVKLSNFLRLFTLSFRIASDKNTQLFVAYHNHFIKNGLLMILLKWCFPKIKRIHFPYDIHPYQFSKELKYYYIENGKLPLKNKFHGWLSLFFDKICFENAHKIITKGFENELDYLKTIYRIQNKPHFVFNFLIEKKDIAFKESKNIKDDKIHLVFIGGITTSEVADNNYKVFEEVLKQDKIVFHIYPHIPYLLDTLKHHENLIVHSNITKHKELIQEISKYDFGFSISIPPKNDFLQAKMASGIKIFDYLSAGLPIIIDNKHNSMANMIKTYELGIIVPFEEIKNIVNYINQCDYNSLLLSVQRNRERFFVDIQSNKLIEFISDN